MAIIGNIAIGMSVGTSGLTKGLNTAKGDIKSFASSTGFGRLAADHLEEAMLRYGDAAAGSGKKAAASGGVIKRSFGAARGAVNGFAASLTSAQGILAGLATGAAATGVLKMASNFAHLDEAVNKTKAVFKDQADGVKANAQAMADAYGMSFTDILDKQSMMGAMLSGVGFSDAAAANYSDVFTRLANDMTRRWDVVGGTTVAMDQLMAALRGSGDAPEKYGVSMTEETVKARAYQMGLARVGQELSEGAKKQARATIIMEQMKSSIGGASSEVGSFGANTEALSGRWENFTTVMGEMFAPTLGSAIGGLGDMIKWLQDVFTANKEAIFSWAGGFAESMGFAVEGTDILTMAVGGLGSAWDVVGMGFKYVQSYITDGLGYIMTGIGKLAESFDWLVTKMGGTATGLGDFFAAYADDLHKLSDEQYKAFEQIAVGPDTGRLMQDSLNKTREGIKQMQQELARKPMELTLTTGAKGTADKLFKSAKPYGEAVRAGSAQAAKAIATARLGGGANTVEKTSRQTADNTKKSVVQQQKMVTSLDALLDKYKVASVVSM